MMLEGFSLPPWAVTTPTKAATASVESNMPQLLFKFLAFAIGLVPSLIYFWATFQHKYEYVSSFFVNQSLLNEEYDFIIGKPCFKNILFVHF